MNTSNKTKSINKIRLVSLMTLLALAFTLVTMLSMDSAKNTYASGVTQHPDAHISLNTDGILNYSGVLVKSNREGSQQLMLYDSAGKFVQRWNDQGEIQGPSDKKLRIEFEVGDGSISFLQLYKDNNQYVHYPGSATYSFVDGDLYSMSLGLSRYSGPTLVEEQTSNTIYFIYTEQNGFTVHNVVELPADPDSYEHMYFAGWYMDSGYTQLYDGRLIFEDMEMYAGYKIVENFVPTPPESMENGEHYEYDGEWFFDEEYTNSAMGKTFSPDTSIYPKWKLKQYVINFVATPITINDSLTLDALTEYMVDADLVSRVGYNLVGWYTDSTFTTQWVDGAKLTGAMTLYAKWEVIVFKVKFIVSGNEYATIDVPYGSTLQRVQQAVETVYEQSFDLYTSEDYSTPASLATTVNADMTFYAELGELPEEPDVGDVAWYDTVNTWITNNKTKAITIGVGACVGIIVLVGFGLLRRRRYG